MYEQHSPSFHIQKEILCHIYNKPNNLGNYKCSKTDAIDFHHTIEVCAKATRAKIEKTPWLLVLLL